MSLDPQRLRALVHECFLPRICVIATADASERMQECCGMASFSAVCEPFALPPAVIRTVPDGLPIELADFAVRFADLSELMEPQRFADETERALVDKVSSLATEESYGPLKLTTRASAMAFAKDRPNLTPWWDSYRQNHVRNTPPSLQELFSLPVACLVVVSTANKAPVDAMARLHAAAATEAPPALREVLGDPKTLRHYVVLTGDDGKDVTEEIRSALGSSSCSFLRAKPGEPSVFRDFVADFVYRSLLPYLEAKARLLLDAVSSKRGLMPLVSWFKTPPKKPEPELVNIEWLTKQLADLLFILRDYAGALAQYRKVAADRTEKNAKHVASALEMGAVAAFLLDPTRRDADAELDKAYMAHLRAGEQRLCVRSTLLLSEILRAQRNWRDLINALLRCAERPEADDLSSALMQEQAALAFLLVSPVLFRKFSMRLVFAGHRFACAKQLKHAFRCYSVAAALYTGRHWRQIDCHLEAVLARHAFLLGRMPEAQEHMHKALDGSGPLAQQASHLREFLHILSSPPSSVTPVVAAAPLPTLPFPLVLGDAVRVFLKSSPASGESAIMDLTWQEMEESLAPPPDFARRRKRRGAKKAQTNRTRLSVISEPIVLELALRNPLRVTLQLAELHLVAEHTPEEGAVDALGPAYEVQPVDVILGPEEKRTVLLQIIPRREGALVVKSIGFQVGGSGVWGLRPITLPRKRLNDTKAHRLTPTYEPDLSLSFRICGDMPLLEVSLPCFPSACFQGEVKRCTLELRNAGRIALHNVRLKLSHPAFFSFAASPADSDPLPDLTTLFNRPFDPSVVPLPAVLEPGASLTVPFWLRAEAVGPQQLFFLFYYESQIANRVMPYRVTKVTQELRVAPSVRVTSAVAPSHASLNAYVLSVEMENVQANRQLQFALCRLTSVSPSWLVEPLSFGGAESPGSTDVGAKGSTQMFFRLRPAPEKPTPADLAHLPLHHCHVSLRSPHGSSGGVPYLDLLLREKEAQRLAVEAESDSAAQSRDLSHSPSITVGFVANANKSQQPREQPRLVDVYGLHLAFFWESTDGQHVGFQSLPSINPFAAAVELASPADAAPATSADSQSLRMLIESPPKLTHDFASQSFCVVPVSVRVKNTSPTNSVSFFLEAIKINSPAAESHQAQSHTRSHFLWTGLVRFNSVTLAPNAETSFTLRACFSKPGVYNVGRLRLVVTLPPPALATSAHAPPSPSINKKELYASSQHLVTIEEP